jgi:hypothetical protein
MRYTLHKIKSDFNNFELKNQRHIKSGTKNLFNIYEILLKVVMSCDFI